MKSEDKSEQVQELQSVPVCQNQSGSLDNISEDQDGGTKSLPPPNKSPSKSLTKRSPLRITKKKSLEPPVTTDINSGVVIGNFHAYDEEEDKADDASEALLQPNIVNGCSRVLTSDEVNSNGKHKYVRRPDDYVVACSERDSRCFLSACQPYANIQSFMIIYCCTIVLQGMFYTYFVSVLSTMQKIFDINSKWMGIIMAATEIGQILGALFLSYYGGKGHRPRWMAFSVLLFGSCVFLAALPHVLYQHYGDSQIYEDGGIFATASQEICRNSSLLEDTLSNIEHCDKNHYVDNAVYAILLISLVGIGFGNTGNAVLGMSYIDDNIDSSDSPTYFTLTNLVKITGPSLGFLLGSLCTNIYISPLVDPGFGPSDPRWIGAWWLGNMMMGSALVLCGCIIVLFPRNLASSKKYAMPSKDETTATLTSYISVEDDALNVSDGKVRTNMSALLRPESTASSLRSSAVNVASANAEDEAKSPMLSAENSQYDNQIPRVKPKLKDFPAAVLRIASNKLLVLRTLSIVTHILPISGLFTFLPKYIKAQFRVPEHTAALVTGLGGISMMAIGIFASGVFIRQFKPTARKITGFIAVISFVHALGMAVLMSIGCDQKDIVGLQFNDYGFANYNKECYSKECGCDVTRYSPVCSGNSTYLSACCIGCTDVTNTSTQNAALQFSNCESLAHPQTAELGMCETDCNALNWFIGVLACFVIISSSVEVGGTMVNLRIPHKDDKTMALGFISFLVALLANVPCPLIYGSLVDISCLVWSEKCGKPGHCQLYDTNLFRTSFIGVTSGLLFLAFLFDILVYIYSKDVELYPDAKKAMVPVDDSYPISISSLDSYQLEPIGSSGRQTQDRPPSKISSASLSLKSTKVNSKDQSKERKPRPSKTSSPESLTISISAQGDSSAASSKPKPVSKDVKTEDQPVLAYKSTAI